MKNKTKVSIVIFLIFLGLVISVLTFYLIPRGQYHFPQKKITITRKPLKAEIFKEGKEAQVKREIDGETKLVPEEKLGQKPETKGEMPAEQKEKKVALLKANPESVTIIVEEGKREKAEFELINNGKKDLFINIYKSEPNESSEEVKKKAKEMLLRKKSSLPYKPGKDDLAKAAFFTGAPWLIQFPCYEILKPAQPASIQVTVDARDLEVGEYKVDLIILGSSEEELLIVPIYAEIGRAPKIKITKVVVDDGFSPSTKGNSNNVANPGEKITLTVYLKNDGMAGARDVNLELSSNDPNFQILGSNIMQVPFVEAKSEFQVSFLAEVLEGAHPEIPPAVVLTTTDREGEKWAENFYAGDPEKIKYPLGLKIKEEDIKKLVETNEAF